MLSGVSAEEIESMLSYLGARLCEFDKDGCSVSGNSEITIQKERWRDFKKSKGEFNVLPTHGALPRGIHVSEHYESDNNQKLISIT